MGTPGDTGCGYQAAASRGGVDSGKGHYHGLALDTDGKTLLSRRVANDEPELLKLGRQAIALLRQLDAACISVDDPAEATVESSDAHPDAETITSFPGLGSPTGARVLAEIGDDRSRFTDAKGLKAFAGAAPATRAFGRSLAVIAWQGQEPAWPRSAMSGRMPA
nr:transposase [Streptomyces sp. NRRL F-2664]